MSMPILRALVAPTEGKRRESRAALRSVKETFASTSQEGGEKKEGKTGDLSYLESSGKGPKEGEGKV